MTTIPPLLVGWFVVVLCFVPLLVFAIVTVVRRSRHDREELYEGPPPSEAQGTHAKYVEPPRGDPRYRDRWQVQPPPRPAGRYDEPARSNGPMSPAAPPGPDRPARRRRPEADGGDWLDDRW